MTTLDFRLNNTKVDRLQWGSNDFITKTHESQTYYITDCDGDNILVKKEEIPALIRALQNIDKLD